MTSPSWKELPKGEDVPLTAGSTYAVVASVSAKTTKAKVYSALAEYFPGISVLSFVEQGETGGPTAETDPDRKQIAAVVYDQGFAGTLAWSKSIPIVAPNIYTLSGAWVLVGEKGSEASLANPWAGALPPPRRPASAWPWILGGAALAALAFEAYVHRDAIAAAWRGAGRELRA
jgi:hypothetical protein